MKRPYWIKLYGRTAPYALIVTPWESQGGSRPSRSYHSWEPLHDELSRVGLKDSEAQHAKNDLDADGGYIVNGQVFLSEEQVTDLGFSLAA